VRVRGREGIKLRQQLVDTLLPGQNILVGTDNEGLTEAANKALGDMDDPPHHRFIGARQLNNGRFLLDLDEEATIWQGKLLKWASFLGHFAPEAMVKTRFYLLIVQFVLLYFKLEGEAELNTVEAETSCPLELSGGSSQHMDGP